MRKSTTDLQIIKKKSEGAQNKYLLRLDRNEKQLEVFEKVEIGKILDYHSLRDDFDISEYLIYEKIKSFDCILGSDETPTPCGIFNVEKVSKDYYVSGYCKGYSQVKFFGYLVIFEDYFIHSDMYLMDVDEEMMRRGEAKTVNVNDKFTAGCVRVAQENLDWLVENVEEKSICVI